MRFLLICFFVCCASLVTFGNEYQPSATTLAQDQRRLEKLNRVWEETTKEGTTFTENYWRASQQTGALTGPRIVHAVIQRGRVGEEEHPTLFLPLIAQLDRAAAVQILEKYKRSKKTVERTLAGEYLKAIEGADVDRKVRYMKGR